MNITLYVIPEMDDSDGAMGSTADPLSLRPRPYTPPMLGVKVWSGKKRGKKYAPMYGFLIGPETMEKLGVRVTKSKNSESSQYSGTGDLELIEGMAPSVG